MGIALGFSPLSTNFANRIIGKKRLANADNYLSGKKPSELPTLDELNYDDFKGHH